MGDLSQPVSEPVPSFTQKSDKVGGRGEKAEGSTLSTDQALGITVISSPSQTPLLWFIRQGLAQGTCPEEDRQVALQRQGCWLGGPQAVASGVTSLLIFRVLFTCSQVRWLDGS